MSNKSKKGFNGTPHAKDRRTRVITRLEAQLKLNKKTTKDGVLELTSSDVERIKKELSIVKTRI